jgi:aryl-alcohol dehydrogenase-like predicted oxidoreductase
MMQYVPLGRSGLRVSRLILGSFNFGGHTAEKDGHALIDAALDLGVNVVDTANTYPAPILGVSPDKGRTEEIIGRWIARNRGRRDDLVLATKVFGDMGPGPNDGRLSAKHLRHALDASLRRLQTDYIDLYQFHHVDRTTPWEEIWQAIDVAVGQGKILYTGSSNFAGLHIAQAQEFAARRLMMGLVSEQALYNLVTRDIERELVPALQEYGVGLLVWSPLHGGLLAGTPRAGGSRRTEGRAAETRARRAEDVAAFERYADEVGLAPSALAMAWLLHQSHVTAPVVGPRTLEHLIAAVATLDIELDAEVLSRLDAIFPGPRTSPEDHAW